MLQNRATFCNVIMLVNYSQVLHRTDSELFFCFQSLLITIFTINRHFTNRYILVIQMLFIKPLTVFSYVACFWGSFTLFHFQGEPRFCKPYRAIGSIKRTLALLFPPVRWHHKAESSQMYILHFFHKLVHHFFHKLVHCTIK